MKHRVKKTKLNRNTSSRKALFKSLITSLIQVGEIKTTESKAKAIKGLTDKLIRTSQGSSVAARRLLARFFGKRDIVNQLVDQVAPAMKDRKSGFTRITPIGNRRGDNAMMVKMELVEKPLEKSKDSKVLTKKSVKPKTATAKKVKTQSSKK